MGRTNPKLWEKAKAEATSKMGVKHSARAIAKKTAKYRK
jgi:hypothetical protein